jgi:hypothetical protein
VPHGAKPMELLVKSDDYSNRTRDLQGKRLLYLLRPSLILTRAKLDESIMVDIYEIELI